MMRAKHIAPHDEFQRCLAKVKPNPSFLYKRELVVVAVMLQDAAVRCQGRLFPSLSFPISIAVIAATTTVQLVRPRLQGFAISLATYTFTFGPLRFERRS